MSANINTLNTTDAEVKSQCFTAVKNWVWQFINVWLVG